MARPVLLGHRANHGDDGRWHRGDPVELDADALVRHAFICGASGFGKTVFSKGLVEEAVLAGIPVIAVDFKGDLASLALTGPLAGAEALRSVFGDDAPAVAAEWQAGATAMGVDPKRAAAYADRSFVRLFTPNSRLGRRVALSGLPSFPDPPTTALERDDRDELIQALVQGFAHSMYGTPAAVKRNEPAVKVVEELVRRCADRGEPLDGAAGIARVLELVSHPPVDAMGGMPIDEYLPPRDKQRLMQMLNSRLLGAERARYEGPRLSVETLLGGVPPGKTALSVLYLGHISDFAEQASVLGQLCAEIYRWMRKTGGSSGVRLMVYVDELGGGDAKHAFYPSAPNNPPSKAPLNLLVRQGRSAGVAMLLATQNPMSVDVRGLGNINTWAVGRLTRKNDHTRIEDLLARMPEGQQRGAKIVSQLPQGVMLTLSDALPGPEYVFGRWLYSIHRQLSPGAVAGINELLGGAEASESLPPPPIRAVSPPPTPEELEDGPTTLDDDDGPSITEPPKPKRASPRTRRTRPPERSVDDEPSLEEQEPSIEVERSTEVSQPVRRPPPAPKPRPLEVLPEVEADHTEAGTTHRVPRHLRDDEDTDHQRTRGARTSESTQLAAVPDDDYDLDEDTDDLLAESQVFPEPREVRAPPPMAVIPELPRARRRRRAAARPPPEDHSGSWPREPTDDGESLTITFARPRIVDPVGWVVRYEGHVWPVPPGGLTVGRSPLADAQLDDRRVSRLHVRLQMDGPNLLVRPLKAKNQTLLDGGVLDDDVRLEPSPSTWTLQLGETEIELAWTPP